MPSHKRTQLSQGTKAAALWHLRWYVASQPHHELARVGPRGISRSGSSDMGSNSRNSNGICDFWRLSSEIFRLSAFVVGWFCGISGGMLPLSPIMSWLGWVLGVFRGRGLHKWGPIVEISTAFATLDGF